MMCPVSLARDLSALTSGGGAWKGGFQPGVLSCGSGADDELQDVLLKAMAKKMRWWEAAEIIGVSDRTMRRWRERLEEHATTD